MRRLAGVADVSVVHGSAARVATRPGLVVLALALGAGGAGFAATVRAGVGVEAASTTTTGAAVATGGGATSSNVVVVIEVAGSLGAAAPTAFAACRAGPSSFDAKEMMPAVANTVRRPATTIAMRLARLGVFAASADSSAMRSSDTERGGATSEGRKTWYVSGPDGSSDSGRFELDHERNARS